MSLPFESRWVCGCFNAQDVVEVMPHDSEAQWEGAVESHLVLSGCSLREMPATLWRNLRWRHLPAPQALGSRDKACSNFLVSRFCENNKVVTLYPLVLGYLVLSSSNWNKLVFPKLVFLIIITWATCKKTRVTRFTHGYSDLLGLTRDGETIFCQIVRKFVGHFWHVTFPWQTYSFDYLD